MTRITRRYIINEIVPVFKGIESLYLQELHRRMNDLYITIDVPEQHDSGWQYHWPLDEIITPETEINYGPSYAVQGADPLLIIALKHNLDVPTLLKEQPIIFDDCWNNFLSMHANNSCSVNYRSYELAQLKKLLPYNIPDDLREYINTPFTNRSYRLSNTWQPEFEVPATMNSLNLTKEDKDLVGQLFQVGYNFYYEDRIDWIISSLNFQS